MTVKEFKHDYFSFKGRLNRKPFLMRLMMLGAISIFFVLIVINAEPHLKEDPAHFATNVRKSLVFWVYYIPLIIASISLGVRRLHDLNLSGWWMLLGSGALLSTVNTAIDLAAAILFYIAQLFNLFLIFFRGTKGPNRFGEDPVPQPVKEKKKTKEERRAEAKARKEAAEAEKRADEELEREIAEAHPDWDEYDRYDAMQEAKAKREAEKAVAEVKDATENKESK